MYFDSRKHTKATEKHEERKIDQQKLSIIMNKSIYQEILLVTVY